MASEEYLRDCGGKQCGYAAFSGEVGCTDGGSYFYAKMLEAVESDFHDAALVKATSQINEILASFPEVDDRGRRLSFLHTPFGTMLAWVSHNVEIPKDAVTIESPKDDHIKALGLIDPPRRD